MKYGAVILSWLAFFTICAAAHVDHKERMWVSLATEESTQ